MAKHYKKVWVYWRGYRSRSKPWFVYEHEYAGWYRNLRTFPEVRENEYLDKYDEDVAYYKIKLRRCRMRKMLPDPWEDYYCHSKTTRSWKMYSKKRKQWQ